MQLTCAKGTWQEVAVFGEGAGGAGVTEHGTDHSEISVAAAAAAATAATRAALRALALRAVKKSGKHHHQDLQRERRSWFLHGGESWFFT